MIVPYGAAQRTPYASIDSTASLYDDLAEEIAGGARSLPRRLQEAHHDAMR
jgi:hypothetical protein